MTTPAHPTPLPDDRPAPLPANTPAPLPADTLATSAAHTPPALAATATPGGTTSTPSGGPASIPTDALAIPAAHTPSAISATATNSTALEGNSAGPSGDGVRGHYPQQLSRALGMMENILITLSAVTPASSVFIIVPAILLAAGGASVLTLALAAVASVFVGLCYAELAAAYPIAGGEYTWAARLLGRSSGFAIFVLTLVNGVLIIAVIALGTGDYLSVAIPSLGGKWVGVGVIAVTTVIALCNIKANAWVTGVFLCVEVSAITALVVLGLAHTERGPDAFVHAQTAAGDGLAGVGIGSLATLIPVALFAYNGYGAAVYYAEETRNATRTIGRVIMICLAATVAIEMLPLAAVVLGAPSMTELLHSDAPMNYFLTARGGSAVNTAVSVGIAVAIVNAVIAIILQIARLLFASARDRSWPDPIDRALGSVHPRLHTPVVATLTVGALAVLAAAALPLHWLIVATGAGLVLVYLFVALAALRIRLARSGIPGGYRMPLWPLPPLIVIGVMAYSAYSLGRNDWQQIAFAAAAMVAGYAYYALYLRPRRDERWTLPEPIHEE